MLEINVKSKVIKFCKRCNKQSIFRFVKSEDYYHCTTCSKNNCIKHRKSHWFKYLAQKANARKRPYSEKITEEMLIKIFNYQEHKCALTGNPLDVDSKWWKPSLDRIDSNLGYTKNNIRIVSWIVNKCKWELTDKDFINMCVKIASYYNKYPYFETSLLDGC